MVVLGFQLTLLSGASSAAEPYLVRDLNESGPPEKPDPSVFPFLDGRAFFAVDDGLHGQELWVTCSSGPRSPLARRPPTRTATKD